MDNKGIKEKFAKLFDDPNRETFKIALNNLTGEYDDLEFKEQEIDEHILAKYILGIANSTNRCEYDDLQNILNKRVSASQDILNINQELNELELLMKRTSFQYKLYYSVNNPDFLKIMYQFKEKKIKRIEKGLGIENHDEN